MNINTNLFLCLGLNYFSNFYLPLDFYSWLLNFYYLDLSNFLSDNILMSSLATILIVIALFSTKKILGDLVKAGTGGVVFGVGKKIGEDAYDKLKKDPKSSSGGDNSNSGSGGGGDSSSSSNNTNSSKDDQPKEVWGVDTENKNKS